MFSLHVVKWRCHCKTNKTKLHWLYLTFRSSFTSVSQQKNFLKSNLLRRYEVTFFFLKDKFLWSIKSRNCDLSFCSLPWQVVSNQSLINFTGDVYIRKKHHLPKDKNINIHIAELAECIIKEKDYLLPAKKVLNRTAAEKQKEKTRRKKFFWRGWNARYWPMLVFEYTFVLRHIQ